MPTESEIRQGLLDQYGPCICPAIEGGCTGESDPGDVPLGAWCSPCGHLDIYWPRFNGVGIDAPPFPEKRSP
jgi:hypothetical protein